MTWLATVVSDVISIYLLDRLGNLGKIIVPALNTVYTQAKSFMDPNRALIYKRKVRCVRSLEVYKQVCQNESYGMRCRLNNRLK